MTSCHLWAIVCTSFIGAQNEHGSSAQHDERYREVSRQLISVERETAIHLRDRGRISDESLRELLNELDLEESHLATT